MIRVRSAGVCHTDLLFVLGKYQATPSLPFIPGSEVAGDVVAVGSSVRDFRPGDRVVSLAPNFGGFAERVAVPAAIAAKIPAAASYESAAALMSSYGTAQHALRQRAMLQRGETLLVTGAAGGAGIAAVQIGACLGAKVIAVCSTEEKARFCLRHGATETIVYEQVDLKSALRRLAVNGVDVVFETVGGTVFEACSRSMAINGRLLVVGFASGHIPKLAINLPLVKVYSIVGVHWLTFVLKNIAGHRHNMGELIGWLREGLISPPIHSIESLANGVAALRLLASREVLGKLVLAS